MNSKVSSSVRIKYIACLTSIENDTFMISSLQTIVNKRLGMIPTINIRINDNHELEKNISLKKIVLGGRLYIELYH